jgi:signal transduction histidine kinase
VSSAPLPIVIATLVAVDALLLGALAWWLVRSRARRIAEAERTAAGHARNAEIASMTRGLAHEIKNPLSTVALNAQLLREEILDSPLDDAERERMTRRVDALAREAGRLRDILNDFLRYAGRMQLDRRQADVRDVAGELGDFFMPQAEQAGVRMRILADESPVVADVDPGLLKQAVLNLMLNAVQSMESLPADRARTLDVAVRHEPAEGRGAAARAPRAVIEVSDTGPGIPPDARAQLFEPYFTTKSGGNGLGLAVTRRIVEAHGGTVQALDAPGGGARFRIELPLRTAAAA